VMPTSLSEVHLIKTFMATLLCASIGGALVGGVANAIADSMGASREQVAGPLIAASSMLIGYLAFRIFVRKFIIQTIVGSAPK
jgi:uncharacterized membrane protein